MRPARCLRRLLLLLALGGTASAASSPFGGSSGPRTEFDAELSLQARAFPARGELSQDRLHPSLALALRLRHEWNEGADRLTLAPFYRYDSEDARRRRGDLREAYYSHRGRGFELHAGLRRVFWGQVESTPLVDVLNQVDLLENIDQTERLGQPMLNLVLLRDWGRLDAFLLPGHRERPFASTRGRLSGPFDIDEAGQGLRRVASGRVDWALRYSHFFGGLELGLAWFEGTRRDPDFELVGVPEAGQPIRLRPVYDAMSQASIDARYVAGDWVFKLEALWRGGDAPQHRALVAGLERTLVGAFGRRWDLGLLAEYLYDDRGRQTPLLQHPNDLFLGLRVGFNDFADSQLLAGVIVDLDRGRQVWSVEASRRLGEHWRLALEARAFAGAGRIRAGELTPLLEPRAQWGVLARDSYLQLDLTRYF